MQDNNNELKAKLRTLQSIAIDMQKETDEQNSRLYDTESEFSKAMMVVNRSISKIMRIKDKSFSHVFYMFFFGLLALLIIFLFFFG